MVKSPLPLFVGDVSLLARNLRRQLQSAEGLPGHVEMLNLLARAGGYRNFQHLKAQHDAHAGLDAPRPQPAEVNYQLVKRVLRLFDAQGRLERWPKKHSERVVCLWALWSRVAARTAYAEPELNALLDTRHRFGDPALLRRFLVDLGMLTRTLDGREYRRVETPPPAEAVELIRRIGR